MKVLHINSADLIGGGERHLVELSSGLAARGHQVHVAVRHNSVLRELLASRQNIHLMPLPLRNAVDFMSARRLARHIREHRVDVIHAHLARDYPIAALASRLSKTPYVITRHLLFPLKPSHRFTLRNVDKVICVSRRVRPPLTESALFFAAHALLTLCKFG